MTKGCVAIALIITMLAACSTADPTSSSQTDSPPDDFTSITPLRGEIRWMADLPPSGVIGSTEGVLVVAGLCDGCEEGWSVTGVSLATGATLWERDVYQHVMDPLQLDIDVADGIVTFLSGDAGGDVGDHDLVALAAATGAELWQTPVPDTRSTHSRSSFGNIELVTMWTPGNVTGYRSFDRTSGELLASRDAEFWISDSVRIAELTIRNDADPGTDDRIVSGVTTVGDVVWQRTDLGDYPDVQLWHASGNRGPAVLAVTGGLIGLNPTTGATIWVADDLFPAEQPLRPMVWVDPERGAVVVCLEDSAGPTVIVRDLETGVERFRTTLDKSPEPSMGAIATWTDRSLVLVSPASTCADRSPGRSGATATGHDAATGEVLWTRTIDEDLRSEIKLANATAWDWPNLAASTLLFDDGTVTELVSPHDGTVHDTWPSEGQRLQLVDGRIVAETGGTPWDTTVTGVGLPGETPVVSFEGGTHGGIHDGALILSQFGGGIYAID